MYMSVVLMEQIVEVLEVAYKVLLGASLNFESTSAVEAWANSLMCCWALNPYIITILVCNMKMMIVTAMSSVMMVSLWHTSPLWLDIERAMSTSPVNFKVEWLKLTYIGHHACRGLERACLWRGSQGLGSWLSYLVEIVCYVIEHKLLSTHYVLIIICCVLLSLLLLWHALVVMLVNFCLRTIMSMMNVRRHSTLLVSSVTIVMIVNVMDVRR
jgi:hypothetical protein